MERSVVNEISSVRLHGLGFWVNMGFRNLGLRIW